MFKYSIIGWNYLFWPKNKTPFDRFVLDLVSDPDSFISDPDRIRIWPKVSDSYGSGSGSGSGSATLPKTQRRVKTLRYAKFELANRCPELGQNNDSQCRHRICNERQSLAIAMYRTVEYENRKKYFWNSVALLCLALQTWWRHWEYRHMACGAMS